MLDKDNIEYTHYDNLYDALDYVIKSTSKEDLLNYMKIL